MRKAHSYIRSRAERKSVLNLFCYSGVFSVCAAAGGAAAVDSVDMSATYLDWARKNFALNKLEDERHRFIRADVIRFLDEALQQRKKWDIIILDPPSFSNSKKMGEAVLDIKRDYQMLLFKCLKLLRREGMIFFSAKARGFQFDADAFMQSCQSYQFSQFPQNQSSQNQSCQNYSHDGIIKNITIKNVTEAMRDEDFKGRRAPFCYIISI
jgi:23S rRNA G2069 N7-methylase RlmK/C1962 C5-methylase RlmI